MVAARTETVIEANVLNPWIREGLTPDICVLDGVYLSRAICKVNDSGKTLVTALNTTEVPVMLKQVSLVLESFDEVSSSRLDDFGLVEGKSTENVRGNKRAMDKLHRVMQVKAVSASSLERVKLLKESLRTDHLNDEEKESLVRTCIEFNDIFHLEGDKLSCTKTVSHSIDTKDSKPIFTKSYRYPEVHKREVNEQISKMLEQGIVRSSTSPWSSPLWVVPKKADASGKQKWRVVIDYRKLNDITVGDAYPLPNITEILDQLGHSKYFTTLDLASGFHQIPMLKEDAVKTAFSTPQGHYEYTRMPFGLKNAPSTFQRLMNNVLAGVQGIKCFVYLDDIVIYSANLESHENKLIEIFQLLRLHNLKLQPDKCEFLRQEVSYLGHIITENGVKPDPSKISVINKFPLPKSTKDIQSFLGLVGYYRRFIDNFSAITKPLTCLLKKDKVFIWENEQQAAFEKLRSILTSESILRYPDFGQPFNLTTDSSSFAIGAVLSQGLIGKDLPIAFASRTLNKAETNYSTTERELLAIIYAVKHFRPYLYGRKFNIITDHKPLVWLFNVKDPGSRLVRWKLKLQEYDYEIIYKPGKLNSNADCLSRIVIPESNVLQTTKIGIDSYEDFLKFHRSKLDSNMEKFAELDESLLSRKDNVGLCVSADLEMSEGIASQIKGMINNYDSLKENSIKLGDILVRDLDASYKVYHLVTKTNFWDYESYENIFDCLINLREKLLADNVKSLSMEKIGNGLNWNKVRKLIMFIFRATDVSISVCVGKVETPSREDINEILKEFHDAPASGHPGFHRMLNKIRYKYNWKGMRKDIFKYVKNCVTCQKNKTSRMKNLQPMEITTTCDKPFEKIALDIVGPLTLTENGNKYILTLQDNLTKYSQAYAIPNHESSTIAYKLVHDFICKFGIPAEILTDQGSDFTSNLIKNVAKLFKIRKVQTSAYRPQSNGALERSHAVLADYLKNYTSSDQSDWDEWLDMAMFSYNTTPHSATKYTPHELVFGCKPELPSSIIRKPEFKYTYDDFLDNLKYRLNRCHEIAKNNLLDGKQRSKDLYDRGITKSDNYNVDEMIFLKNENCKPRLCKKLSQNFSGPYKIIEINKPNCTILIKNKPVTVHMNRIKRAFLADC
jgi:hypothetical protein